ncbi:MAG: hypothetical protein WDN25_15205 [Acetobacteraceae bacterium]
MLAAVSRIVFGRETWQQDGDRLEFVIDGVRIEARSDGPRSVRLVCVILPELPEREVQLRKLMSQYLRYCDVGTDVLCTDGEGRLLLVAEIGAGDRLRDGVVSFCDAAIHWTKMAERQREVIEPMRGPMMIFP